MAANLSTGFFSIGGQSTASPALTAISPSALVAFARGTNGAGYYTRYCLTLRSPSSSLSERQA